MQKAFFQWLAIAHRSVYALAFAVPNGARRSVMQGKRLRDEGMKAGIPDVAIMIPSSPYHGMFIEFKIHPNKPTEEQLLMIGRLRGYYCVRVCYSLEEAMEAVREYLGYK